MQIVADLSDPNVYSYLTLIVEEFEKACIVSESPQGLLVAMRGPLEGMDQVVRGSEEALKKIQDSRRRQTTSNDDTNFAYTIDGNRPIPKPEAEQGTVVTANVEPFEVQVLDRPQNPTQDPNTPQIPQLPVVAAQGGVSLDADLAQLFGANGEKGEEVRKLMSECYNCDLRVHFNWQLPSFDLLLPIANLLASINASLDRIERLTNPAALLKSLCRLMNDFQLLCIPDWILILLALKMLFRKYLMLSLNIKIDWTIIFGPLLSLIIEAIATLIQQVVGVIFQPIDCALNVLKTIESLEQQIEDTINSAKEGISNAKDSLNQLKEGNIFPGHSIEGNVRDLFYRRDPDGFGLEGEKGLGAFGSQSRAANQDRLENAWLSLPSGFEITPDRRTLQSEIEKIDIEIPLVSVMVSALEEAKDFVADLVAKILFTLRSIKGLVGGGLTVQLNALGFMGFILQLIRVVMLIIQLLKQGIKPADWCKHLEENPQVLEGVLRATFDRRALVERSTEGGRIVINGVTTPIESCVSSRPTVDEAMLNQWIADLRRTQ